jgi:hypothetical protein
MQTDNKNIFLDHPGVPAVECDSETLFPTDSSPTRIEENGVITTNDKPLPRIYIASKTRHAPKWKRLRSEGYNIISTWIDEAGEGQSNYNELSVRCITEIRQSDFVVLYCEPGEILKGALIEAGAALAFGEEVRCVGQCETLSRVFQQHPLWIVYSDIYAAVENK